MNYYISDLHLFHKNVTRAGKDFDVEGTALWFDSFVRTCS